MKKLYVSKNNICIKDTIDNGETITVKTEFVRNNRYYIKKYNESKKKGLKWPNTLVSSWAHSEDKELFGC